MGRSYNPCPRTAGHVHLRRGQQTLLLWTFDDRKDHWGNWSLDSVHDSRQHGLIVDGQVRGNCFHPSVVRIDRQCVYHPLELYLIWGWRIFLHRFSHLLGEFSRNSYDILRPYKTSEKELKANILIVKKSRTAWCGTLANNRNPICH